MTIFVFRISCGEWHGRRSSSLRSNEWISESFTLRGEENSGQPFTDSRCMWTESNVQITSSPASAQIAKCVHEIVNAQSFSFFSPFLLCNGMNLHLSVWCWPGALFFSFFFKQWQTARASKAFCAGLNTFRKDTLHRLFSYCHTVVSCTASVAVYYSRVLIQSYFILLVLSDPMLPPVSCTHRSLVLLKKTVEAHKDTFYGFLKIWLTSVYFWVLTELIVLWGSSMTTTTQQDTFTHRYCISLQRHLS